MSQDENPYQTPVAELHGGLLTPTLASRGARLGAVLIDTLLGAVICVPLLYFVGFYDGVSDGVQPGFGMQALGALLWMVVFMLINGHLLKLYGQTVGKRLLKIAVVDEQGNTPAFVPMMLKRYLLWWLLVYIPFVGSLLAVLDCLFVFRADRRCLHDLAAGTRVVALN